MARTHRGSVRPVSTTGLYQASNATAGTVYGVDLMIRSGGPPNCLAKFHTDSSGHCLGAGISLRSPLRAPASTHFTIVSICASLNDRSFLNSCIPTVLSTCQGGICRALTRDLIDFA